MIESRLEFDKITLFDVLTNIKKNAKLSQCNGQMSELAKELVLKTSEGVKAVRVRIPVCPPYGEVLEWPNMLPC